MLVDVGPGKPRRDPPQPAVNRGIVSPRHRHQPERRVDREALPDDMLTIAAVAHRVDPGEVVVVDPRHRTAGRQTLMEIDQCGSARVEEGKLVAQATNQSEQPAAQSVAAIAVAGDPPTTFAR